MAKKRKKYAKQAVKEAEKAHNGQKATMFSFGDPESVMQGELSNYLGVYMLDNGSYYQTPVPLIGLARLLRANAYHGPMLEFKANMILRGFVGSAALTRATMCKAVIDYLVFSNMYLQKLTNFLGRVVGYRHLQSINMRRRKEEDCYCMLGVDGDQINFLPGEVLHIKNYDVIQDIYGVPWYLGAIQSMLLQEDATLFRRRYYKNGAHMGYIFYSSSSYLDPVDEEALKTQISKSKGVGNFRNLFIHLPNGREKDIQIIPVGDFSTRDELATIKSISRDDIIAAHRIPPALANIIPTVAGGLGDITKADEVYMRNEIRPIQEELSQVNDFLPPDMHVHFAMDAPVYGIEDDAQKEEIFPY